MTAEVGAGPELTPGSAWLLSVLMFLLEPRDENLQTDSLAYKLIALFYLIIEFPSRPYYKVCRQYFWVYDIIPKNNQQGRTFRS